MRKVLYLLSRLSDDDIEWIAAAGEHRLLPVGAALRREKTVSALTFVLNGAISVTVAGKGEVARLVSGDVFGEMPSSDEQRPSIAATIVEPALILSISRDALSKKIDSDPMFAARLEAAIAMLASARTGDAAARRGDGDKSAASVEFDEEFMENVHLAGARFDRMLKTALSR